VSNSSSGTKLEKYHAVYKTDQETIMATGYEDYESVANAPPFSPQQVLALRRIFTAIRRDREARRDEG
jgi:hypothetical protein